MCQINQMQLLWIMGTRNERLSRSCARLLPTLQLLHMASKVSRRQNPMHTMRKNERRRIFQTILPTLNNYNRHHNSIFTTIHRTNALILFNSIISTRCHRVGRLTVKRNPTQRITTSTGNGSHIHVTTTRGNSNPGRLAIDDAPNPFF